MRRSDRFRKLISVLLVSAITMALFSACSFKKGDRIEDLYFLSCTEYNNVLKMNEESIGAKWRSGLLGDSAKELVKEVEAIPEPASADGEPIYIIRLKYLQDGVSKTVEKKGYSAFPDNWDRIVDLLNQVANGYKTLSNSREIAKIDADYLRKNFKVDESVLPDDMTLEDVIREMPITYMTLFENGSAITIQNLIVEYLFERYGLYEHQPEKLDEHPKSSSEAELRAFAQEKLDEAYLEYGTSYSCAGTYKGANYTIIRYDEVQTYLDKEAEFWTKCGFERVGKEFRYRAELRDADGGAMVTQSKDVPAFVDASGRFIVLAENNRPSEIAEVIL